MMNSKKGKIILSSGIVILLSIIAIFTLFVNNKLNVSLFGAKTEKSHENLTINTNAGDGTVTGEVVIGGTLAGYKGKAYADGHYTNGYCANHGASLYGTYVNGGELNTYHSAYDVNNAKANCAGQIRWLLDNIIRLNLQETGHSETVVSEQETAYYKQNLKNILTKQGKSAVGIDSLTNEQIFQVQQYVLWQYTQNQTSATPVWANNSNDAKADLYAALVAEANTHADYASTGKEYVDIVKDSSFKIEQVGEDVLVGPININNPQGKTFLFKYENLNLDGNVSGKVYGSDKTTEILNNSYINYKGQAYVKITNYKFTKYNYVYNFTGTIKAITYKTDAKYWEKAGFQSVITLGRQSQESKLEINTNYQKKGEIDLSLKKMITAVDQASVEKANGFNVDRHSEFNVDVTPLKNGMNNAKYIMNKTPVQVRKGQTVDYQIRVYNEGEVNAKALEINDYIPVGLQVKKVYYKNNTELTTDVASQNHYIYDEANGVLNVVLDQTDFIQPFDGITVNYDYITVRCLIKDDAQGILTNVAEIRKYQTENGEIRVDRDSTSDNWISPTGEKRTESDKGAEQWRNYSNNQQDLLDGQWHPFVSQDQSIDSKRGDDDDFEKVKIIENYTFKIKKVNQLDEGIDNVKFNITKKTMKDSTPSYTTENFDNVETEDSEITYNGEIAYDVETEEKLIAYPYVMYKIQEIPTEDGQWIQLNKPMTLTIFAKEGKVTGYLFSYNGNSYNGTQTESRTYYCPTEMGVSIQVKVELSGNNITMQVQNIFVENGEYGLKLKKISSGTEQPMQGVKFIVNKSNISFEGETVSENLPVNLTDENGYTNEITQIVTQDKVNIIDKYVITEEANDATSGYRPLESSITVLAYKCQTQSKCILDYWKITNGDQSIFVIPGESGIMTIEENNIKYNVKYETVTTDGKPVLTLTVPNPPDNIIPFQLRKVAAEDGTTVLGGAEFKISRGNNVVYDNNCTTGTLQMLDNVEAGVTSIEYKIEEIKAPEGYDNIYRNKYIKVQVTLLEGEPTAAVAKVYNTDNTENTELSSSISAAVSDVYFGETSYKAIDLKIQDPKTEKIIDLALKKVITQINDKDVKTDNGFDGKYDRLTEDLGKVRINCAPLQAGGDNAEYYLNKTPIEVLKGDRIKYQIRIYNEGTEEAATASEITDYLPTGVTLENVYYRNESTPLVEDIDYIYDSETGTLKIKALKNKDLIPVYAGEETLNSDYVTVECLVDYKAEGILTNVAQISEYKTVDGVIAQDRDSYADDWKNPVDGNSDNNATVDRSKNSWINYAGYKSNVIEEGMYKNYIGQQDDDDFEKIKVVELDLVLKKIISKINNNPIDAEQTKFIRFKTGEDIEVETAYMNRNKDITTADYYLNKTPIIVKSGDTVTYQIRIYNEGSIDATASTIADYIPKGLTLAAVAYHNTPLTAGEDYLYDETTNVLQISALKNRFISKYTGSIYNNNEPSFDYVDVTCNVNGAVRGVLTNVAEITKYQTHTEELVIDRDSQTVGKYGQWVEPTGSNKYTLEGKSGSAWSSYYKNAIQTGEFLNYPGQQDDDDFEKVVIEGNYSLQVQKVSAIDNTKGLENVDIKIGENTYKTNENGFTNVVGPIELENENELDTYTIEEIATNDDNYIKLKNPINIGIVKKDDGNGYLYVSGYKINTQTNNMDSAITYNLADRTVYVEDEDGNYVKVKITFVRPFGNEQLVMRVIIENTIKGSQYETFIKKVDETGNDINGAKFNIAGRPQVTVENGSTSIGRFAINNYNINVPEIFDITEVEAPLGHYKLKDSLKLTINKGYDENKTNCVVTSMQLSSGELVSETGTDITLENVMLENQSKKVNITAKLEENSITITVPNIEKEFDLSLRKFITKVNGEKLVNSREPVVNVEQLKLGTSTTATYNHSKEPVEVMVSDIVEYTIRVYNEGPRDGYAKFVMDDVPDGVEMIAPEYNDGVPENVNAGYDWKMYKQTEGDTYDFTYDNKKYVETLIASEAEVIATDHLSEESGKTNIIKAFEPSITNILDYKDLKVEFKVKSTATEGTVITNYAQISDDSDDKNEDVIDRDSTPNEWNEGEDDQDIEKIVIAREKQYDLALQKFITGVKTGDNTREITGREPVFSKNSSATTGDGYEYKPEFKDLEPVQVNCNDIVTYNLRVYNEGEADAYAAEIVDDIPEGLEFVPYTEGDGTVNSSFRWKMYKIVSDEEIAELPAGTVVKELNGVTTNGEKKFEKCIETTDVKEADYVVTDFLSKEHGEEMVNNADVVNPNIIPAFEPTTQEKLTNGPAFKEVKVQFKVTYKPTTKEETEKQIVNFAQISEETDRVGEDIIDRDSTPNEWIEGEDDQDKEKIKVKYFDLSLVKWVSEAVIIEDGVEKVTPGNRYEDLENKNDHRLIYAKHPDAIGDYTDLEPVVKVDIPKSKLNSTVVKFKYQIRVSNEGQIDGYAKEITDYIPNGMKFVPEDNPLWQEVGDGKVITTQLADTLLTVGGEAKTVEIVYTWTNNENNLGLIVNTAEISKDDNDIHSPDIDSTPNNQQEGEDDIDDAAVLLSVRTGEKFNSTYIVLAVCVIAVITSGTILIKKYVL